MTTPLPELLRDLAEEAPEALSAGDLWRSGRRRHRRRLTVAVAVAVAVAGRLVAGTAALGIGGWRSTRPEPAAPPATRSGPMQIPDHLFNPSPWTPSTRAPGRLVALLSATRDHLPFGSDRNAPVGVAAGSQTYRFLDLPGRSPVATDAFLSPDGLHLAYWVRSRPGVPATNRRGLTGIAVLDLVTGKVERHEVQSRFGLAPQSLTWLDDSTLGMVSDHFTSLRPNAVAGRSRTYLFTVGNPSGYAALAPARVLDVPVTTWPNHVFAPVCPGLFAEMEGYRRLHVYTSDQNNTQSDIHLSLQVTSVVYDPHHHLVAATKGNIDASGPTSGRLVLGRVDHGRVSFATVPGTDRYQQVLTWVDPDHVATMRQTRAGLVSDVVDVRTGVRRELTSKPRYAFTVARDALRHATAVPGIAPPSPWNPRRVTLGALVVLVLAGGAAVVARRSHVRGCAGLRGVRRGSVECAAAHGVPADRQPPGRRGPRADRAAQGGAALGKGAGARAQRTSHPGARVGVAMAPATVAGDQHGPAPGTHRPRVRRRRPARAPRGAGPARSAAAGGDRAPLLRRPHRGPDGRGARGVGRDREAPVP